MKSEGRALAAHSIKVTKKENKEVYTWEIDNYFREKNYYLEDYIEDFHEKVFKTSPQIKLIKFEGIYGSNSKYYVATDDANWTLWVKNKMA